VRWPVRCHGLHRQRLRGGALRQGGRGRGHARSISMHRY
jgi:hypothetical protein